jgi:hypothetical protein
LYISLFYITFYWDWKIIIFVKIASFFLGIVYLFFSHSSKSKELKKGGLHAGKNYRQELKSGGRFYTSYPIFCKMECGGLRICFFAVFWFFFFFFFFLVYWGVELLMVVWAVLYHWGRRLINRIRSIDFSASFKI